MELVLGELSWLVVGIGIGIGIKKRRKRRGRRSRVESAEEIRERKGWEKRDYMKCHHNRSTKGVSPILWDLSEVERIGKKRDLLLFSSQVMTVALSFESSSECLGSMSLENSKFC